MFIVAALLSKFRFYRPKIASHVVIHRNNLVRILFIQSTANFKPMAAIDHCCQISNVIKPKEGGCPGFVLVFWSGARCKCKIFSMEMIRTNSLPFGRNRKQASKRRCRSKVLDALPRCRKSSGGMSLMFRIIFEFNHHQGEMPTGWLKDPRYWTDKTVPYRCRTLVLDIVCLVFSYCGSQNLKEGCCLLREGYCSVESFQFKTTSTRSRVESCISKEFSFPSDIFIPNSRTKFLPSSF